MEPIIKIDHLKKYYNKGKTKALDDLSLSLMSGKVYGLIGPNGAGKTTLVKLILGAINPTAGSIQIFNDSAGSLTANEKIGYVCEKTALPANENPYEYLMFMCILSKIELNKARKIIKRYLAQFGLESFAYKKIKTFSSGMKKKVQIISALLSNPELLILDEPTANLDPKIRYEIFNFIKETVINKGKTVILCSHNLFELEKIVDDIIMINKGKLVLQGSYSRIADQLNKSKELVVRTNNDEKLIEFVKTHSNIIIKKRNPITLSGPNPDDIKRLLVKYCYEEQVLLDELIQVKKSLYEVFDFFNRNEKDGVRDVKLNRQYLSENNKDI